MATEQDIKRKWKRRSRITKLVVLEALEAVKEARAQEISARILNIMRQKGQEPERRQGIRYLEDDQDGEDHIYERIPREDEVGMNNTVTVWLSEGGR